MGRQPVRSARTRLRLQLRRDGSLRQGEVRRCYRRDHHRPQGGHPRREDRGVERLRAQRTQDSERHKQGRQELAPVHRASALPPDRDERLQLGHQDIQRHGHRGDRRHDRGPAHRRHRLDGRLEPPRRAGRGHDAEGYARGARRGRRGEGHRRGQRRQLGPGRLLGGDCGQLEPPDRERVDRQHQPHNRTRLQLCHHHRGQGSVYVGRQQLQPARSRCLGAGARQPRAYHGHRRTQRYDDRVGRA